MTNPEKQPAKEPEKKNDPKLKNADDQLDNFRGRLQESWGKVESAYSEAERKIRTPMATFQEGVTKDILKMPLDQLGKEIEKAILDQNGGMLEQGKAEKFGKRLDRITDGLVAYINKIAGDTGLNAEAVVKMAKDVNLKASRFADLLLQNNFPDIEQAMLFALGSRGDSPSLSVAGDNAQETVLKYLKSDFEKADSSVMSSIWMVFAHMDVEVRVKIAKAYIKGKPADKAEAFLERGNAMGVFNSTEIKEINPKKNYSEVEIKNQDLIYSAQTDLRKEVARLVVPAYGTENAAGKMLNIRNVLMAGVEAGAIFTVFGNIVTGVYQGGSFRGTAETIKRLFNPQSGLALGVIGLIEGIRSGKVADEIFGGSKDEKIAAASLRNEIKNNTKLDELFKQGDYAGAKVFHQFVMDIKGKESDISKFSDMLTPSQFISYLDVKIAEKKPKKDGEETYDYVAIKEAFEKAKPTEIYNLAKAFDTLNIGAKNAKDKYDLCSKEAPTTNTDKKTA
ncbi:MAG: hypothetical protein NTZ25_00600 [Candidatus Peregrinibacteria bacterium]|nr:hypothetical protein [Candidatus Peregrinibacteria bacterium]